MRSMKKFSEPFWYYLACFEKFLNPFKTILKSVYTFYVGITKLNNLSEFIICQVLFKML